MAEHSPGRLAAVHRPDNGLTFATVLRAAMTARGYSAYALGRAIGADKTAPWRWLNGKAFPSLFYVDRLADLLLEPELRRLALQLLHKRCARGSCRRRFLASAQARNRRLYCSKACQVAVTRKGYVGRVRKARISQFEALESAIAAHCDWCQPDGICRDSECALRGCSPLPLIQLVRRKIA